MSANTAAVLDRQSLRYARKRLKRIREQSVQKRLTFRVCRDSRD